MGDRGPVELTGHPLAHPEPPAAARCPHVIRHPVMVQRWETLTFLHWPLPAAAVQARLPAGLRVQTWGGTAWVGLVPFFMRVALPGTPSVPWLSRFCETNVRTYVSDAAGRSGIWFFSLDAARLGAVLAARAGYRLPYFWSRMRLHQPAGGAELSVEYRCVRRGGPAGSGPRSRVRVRVGPAYRTADLGDLDHFLTARWTLFSRIGGRLWFAHAEHPPWPLRRAEVELVDDELVVAAGLPRPAGPVLVHFADGVDVRIGRPHPPRGRRPASPPLG
jgi:uncharacterized protein YqjF (DUF2071 family)